MLKQYLGGTGGSPTTSSLPFPLRNVCWSQTQKNALKKAALDWQQSTSGYQKQVINELHQDVSSRTEEIRGHSGLQIAGQFQLFAVGL